MRYENSKCIDFINYITYRRGEQMGLRKPRLDSVTAFVGDAERIRTEARRRGWAEAEVMEQLVDAMSEVLEPIPPKVAYYDELPMNY